MCLLIYTIYQLHNGSFAIDINDIQPRHVQMKNVKNRFPIKTFCQHVAVFNSPHGADRSIDPIIFCVDEKYVHHEEGETLKIFIVKSSRPGNVFMMIVTTKEHAVVLVRKFMERVKDKSLVLSSEKSWSDITNPTRIGVL